MSSKNKKNPSTPPSKAPPVSKNRQSAAQAELRNFEQEIDEELRRDQLVKLWRRFGVITVTIILLLIAAFGGWLYYQNKQRDISSKQSEMMQSALDELEIDNITQARSILEKLVKEGKPGYQAMAQVLLAGMAELSGKKEDSIKFYDKLAQDLRLAEPWRELATFKSILLRYDDMSPDEAIEALRPLAQDGKPWFGVAGELLAVAYIRADQPESARAILEALIGSRKTPTSLSNRLNQLVTSLPPAEDLVTSLPPAEDTVVAEKTPEKKKSEKTKKITGKKHKETGKEKRS